jgi:hypothetical protein
MVMGKKLGIMVKLIRGNLKKGKEKDKGFSNGQIIHNTKVNLRTIKEVV